MERVRVDCQPKFSALLWKSVATENGEWKNSWDMIRDERGRVEREREREWMRDKEKLDILIGFWASVAPN